MAKLKTTKNTAENLANYLKDLRIEKGLSQKELADKLGYTSAQFVSNWERGLAQPPVKIIKRLAVLLAANPNELFDTILKTTQEAMLDKFNSSKVRTR